MERWDKLQQRLEIVNARRAARLVELQRRADEDNQCTRLDAAAGAAGLEVPVTALSQPTATMGLASGSASSTAASARLAALKKARSSSRAAVNQASTAESVATTPVASAAADLSSKVAVSTIATVAEQPGSTASAPTEAVGEDGAAKRSKAREKKVKRRQRELLEEATREAELAALDEAIAQNCGSSAAPPARVDPTVLPSENTKSSADRRLVFPEVGSQSAPVRCLAARQHVLPCSATTSMEGFQAWRQVSQKKVNVAARADIARCSAVDVCEALGASKQSNPELVLLSPSYSAPAGERAVFAKLESDDTGNLLAQLTRDLAARGADGGVLNQHVMQRLYVLLQNDPVTPVQQRETAAGSSGDVSIATLSEVMVLRLLLGPEIGLLSSDGELQSMLESLTLLHFNRNQAGKAAGAAGIASSMELEVRAEVWKLLFDLLLRCTDTQVGGALAVQCGLGTVLADLTSALLCCMEAHRKLESSDADFGGMYPTALTMAAAAGLAALARMLSVQPVGSSATAGFVGCSQATQDALLWYVFTLGLVPSLGDLMRLRSQHWQHRRTYHYLAADNSSSSEKATAGPAEVKTVQAVDGVAVAVDFFVGTSELLVVVCCLVR